MKVLSRYFLTEFLKVFLLCLLIFLFLFLVIDFGEKIDDFIDADVSKGMVLAYFFYKVPYVLIEMTPVAILISVIFIFSIFRKNREIIALKTSGQNIVRLSKSIVLFSLFISVITFLFSEFIVSIASSRSNEIWETEVEKHDPHRFYWRDQIWYKSNNAIYWIRHYDINEKIMQNPTFYFFDKDFHLIRRIDGKRGIWKNGVWKIEEGTVRKVQEDGGYDLEKFDDLFLEIPETPETFARKIKQPEEMSFLQLKKFSERVKNEGYDNTRYLVDMNMKLAFPLLNLILVFIGIPIALEVKIGGIPLAISIGVSICFLYMVLMSFSRSLGLSGILPPVLSAWTANITFILFGIYLMMNVKK